MVKDKILAPVRPNIGLEAIFRKRLIRLIEQMNSSYIYWIGVSYRQNPPVLAMDASAARTLLTALRELSKRWLKKFDDAALQLAKFYSKSIQSRSERQLKQILKDGGISVEFTMTPAMKEVMQASVAEQVSLIKSIPQQYLTQVEGMVMRSVQTGRDLGQLSKDMQNQLGVTKRRAALISRDQNNKATAVITRVRQMEVAGDDAEAIWVHSHAGKKPRKTHVQAGADKVRYKCSEGWYDPDPKVNRKILPGELINCRCISRLVVPGFS